MTLQEYIKRQKWTQSQAAKELGVSKVNICRWLGGVHKPSLAAAHKIEDATGRKVRTESFLK